MWQLSHCLSMFQWTVWSDSSVSDNLWWSVRLMGCLSICTCLYVWVHIGRWLWEGNSCYCVYVCEDVAQNCVILERNENTHTLMQADVLSCYESLAWRDVRPQFSPSSFGVHHCNSLYLWACECLLELRWLCFGICLIFVCLFVIVEVEWGQWGEGMRKWQQLDRGKKYILRCWMTLRLFFFKHFVRPCG